MMSRNELITDLYEKLVDLGLFKTMPMLNMGYYNQGQVIKVSQLLQHTDR